MRRPKFIARQGRCPSGLLGMALAHVMARETASENAMALELLELQPDDQVLEIGFGHGRTLGRAAEIVQNGLVAGVDQSEAMRKVAARYNRDFIVQRRIELNEGTAREFLTRTAVLTRFTRCIRSISGPTPSRTCKKFGER